MATNAQILANRENSQSSTGPRTSEGRLASSRNAMSHGLSAADPVLPHEDRNEFNALIARYVSDFSSASAHEFLVAQMAGARWKLDRVERIEASIFGDLTSPGLIGAPHEVLMAKAMMDQTIGGGLSRLDRYRANLERTYLRCARELRVSQKSQNEAKSRQADQKNTPAVPESQTGVSRNTQNQTPPVPPCPVPIDRAVPEPAASHSSSVKADSSSERELNQTARR
jgi:hypothetical protein